MAERTPVYVFRDPHFAPAADTIVSAAPLEAVVKAYGRGGHKDTAGLIAAFGGAAVFRDDATEQIHLGVWGARKASKFRADLRRSGVDVDLVKAPPPGRLAWYSTK